MNDLSTPRLAAAAEQQDQANKIRFVTAASLFDGHDASINIMRRILQSNGVEVVHLGHKPLAPWSSAALAVQARHNNSEGSSAFMIALS